MNEQQKQPEEKKELTAHDKLKVLAEHEPDLEKQKVLKQHFDTMDKVWNSMSRKQKRKFKQPSMRYSNRVKSRLKQPLSNTTTKK